MENKELLLQILKNTEYLKTRLDKVEENTEKRFANIESKLENYNQRLDYIEKSHGEKFASLESRLDYIEKNHGERLQNIENIVTRIEKEHGEKIQILFDYFVDQDSKNKRINSKIHRLCKKSDEHDTRIFALEFYKSEKLASK